MFVWECVSRYVFVYKPLCVLDKQTGSARKEETEIERQRERVREREREM